MRRAFFLVIVTLLVSLYVRAHYLTLEDLEVSQTELSSLTDTTLFAKRPLVIVDRVHNHRDLARLSVFRLLHIWASRPRTCARDERDESVSTARFTLITQEHSDITGVEIRHPRTRAGAIIVLRRQQTLVLPPMWRYRCPHGATIHELHDCVSLCLRVMRFTSASRPSGPAKREGTSR